MRNPRRVRSVLPAQADAVRLLDAPMRMAAAVLTTTVMLSACGTADSGPVTQRSGVEQEQAAGDLPINEGADTPDAEQQTRVDIDTETVARDGDMIDFGGGLVSMTERIGDLPANCRTDRVYIVGEVEG